MIRYAAYIIDAVGLILLASYCFDHSNITYSEYNHAQWLDGMVIILLAQNLVCDFI